MSFDYPPIVTDWKIPLIQKMYKALMRAFEDHKQARLVSRLDLRYADDKVVPLSPVISHHAEKGKVRKEMEDAHFVKGSPRRILAGIFDGHKDKGEIASYASKQFETSFETEVSKEYGEVKIAFSNMMTAIHDHVTKDNTLKLLKGSTALVIDLELDTNVLYTATLGDSWAKVYRCVDGEILSIPLSKKKDWFHEGERARLDKFLQEDSEKNAVEIRFYKEAWSTASSKRNARLMDGLNVSRALADSHYGPRISQSPNVTAFQLQPDDFLLMGCDGLWDYVKEDFLIKAIQENWGVSNIAEILTSYVLNKCRGSDNVTIIGIWMQRELDETTLEDAMSDSDEESTQECKLQEHANGHSPDHSPDLDFYAVMQ